jgi:HlyD family secretion protein
MKKWTELKRPAIVGLVLVLAIGIGARIWWHSRSKPKLIFSTAEVKRGDLIATISSTGTIEPEEVVDVGAQVAGLIRSFGKDKKGNTIDYGSIVEEGTILAKIDESVYAADLALAEAQLEKDKAGELSAAANLEQMKAKLAMDEANWVRAQALARRNLLAQTDFDSAKANYEISRTNVSVADAALAQAKAAIVQAQAMLDKARRNLDFCTIKSPVKGVIIDRRVNIGQTVVSSFNAPSLFLIAKDLTKMQIWVAVNEADVGRIVPGTPVTFTCDAFPREEFNGTVGKVRLNATMTQNVVMYTVEVNTENSQNILLPYLTANVRFVVGRESNAFLVPNAALRWSPSSLAQVSPGARSLMSADPKQNAPVSSSKPPEQGKGSKGRLGIIWVKDGKFVRPVEVKVGISDGTNTAVAADTLREGQEVVTGEIAETAQPVTQSPFVPQIRRR